MTVCLDFETMVPHAGDSRCVCTDGYEEYRDVMQMCNSELENA